MPALAPWQWALAAACAMFVGVAKTGVPGFGIAAVPLMEHAVGGVGASAGWLLPLLCVADLFAIAWYRRQVYARRLFDLAPWVLLGGGAGLLALRLGEAVLRPMTGAIVLSMLAMHVIRRLRPDRPVPAQWHHGARYGVAAGFATTVANAAGPVMSVYLLSKRLPKEELIAAGAWFFFLVNLLKVPFFAHLGMITRPSLTFDAVLLPALALGALVGRKVVRRMNQRVFETVVLALAAAATLLLFIPKK
jgi:uncharacterized membrane protein YfcA